MSGGRVGTIATTAAITFAVSCAVLAGAPSAGATSTFPDAASASSASRAATYLAQRQGADGSVPAGWRADQVAEAVVALVAAGRQQSSVDQAVGFLERTASAGASSGPFAGRIVSALVAAGRDPRNFAGTNFVARTASYYDPVSGSYGGNLYGDALTMLALMSADETVPVGALTRLRVSQCRDGGWSYQAGCAGPPDTDTTSMALSVFATAVGPTAAEVRSGREWLRATQNESGCWGHQRGSVDNANSCSLVMSAVVAMGERPDDATWTADGRDPPAALRALQLPSGAFQYRHDVSGPNDYATLQAVAGIAGRSYPVRRWPQAEDVQNPTPSDVPDPATTGPDPGAPAEPAAGSDPSTTSSVAARRPYTTAGWRGPVVSGTSSIAATPALPSDVAIGRAMVRGSGPTDRTLPSGRTSWLGGALVPLGAVAWFGRRSIRRRVGPDVQQPS